MLSSPPPWVATAAEIDALTEDLWLRVLSLNGNGCATRNGHSSVRRRCGGGRKSCPVGRSRCNVRMLPAIWLADGASGSSEPLRVGQSSLDSLLSPHTAGDGKPLENAFASRKPARWRL